MVDWMINTIVMLLRFRSPERNRVRKQVNHSNRLSDSALYDWAVTITTQQRYTRHSPDECQKIAFVAVEDSQQLSALRYWLENLTHKQINRTRNLRLRHELEIIFEEGRVFSNEERRKAFILAPDDFN
jgi:hypothetical protein